MRYYTITVVEPRPAKADLICKKCYHKMFMGNNVIYSFHHKEDVMEAEELLIEAGAKFIKNGKPFVPKERGV